MSWVTDLASAPAPDPAQVWTFGTLTANEKLADDKLAPLTITLGGPKFWKSNNPEIYTGTGWLMQNSRRDASRGGQANPVSGCTPAYFFHINKSGGTAYVHFLASNPQPGAVTISAKGSAYNNASKPLTGKATGQSYAVSKDWRGGNFLTNFSNRSVASGGATEIAKLTMGPNNMGDGRFEVCSSAGVYFYTVVTTTGTTTDAINKSQGLPAAGEIKSTTANTYGREGGVYSQAQVSGLTHVALPAGGGQYLGFAFDTNDKFNSRLQEQTSFYNSRLADSADRTYGNYGHEFDTTLRLYNTGSRARRVRLSFGTSLTSATNTPSFTFNSAARYNGANVDLFTTPTLPRQLLSTFGVPANDFYDARILVTIAGLGVTNQQLILETVE